MRRSLLNVVQLPDPLQNLVDFAGRTVDGLEELAPRMRPAGDFADRVVRSQKDVVVAAIGVGVQITLEPPQEARRSVAGATLREVIDRVGIFVGDVGPEAAGAAAVLSRRKHCHGRVVGPQHGRLQQQLFLPLVERPQQFRGRLHPIALGAARDVQTVSHEEVFLTVERQVVAELGDDDLRDQAWSGDATSNRPHRRRRACHAVLAVSAGVLGSHVDVHFELRRDVLQNPALVLANAIFRPAAARTLLVRFAQVMLVPIVRQLVEVEFSATATRRPWRGGSSGVGSTG